MMARTSSLAYAPPSKARELHQLAVLDASSAQRRLEVASELSEGLKAREALVAERTRKCRELESMVDGQTIGWDGDRRKALRDATQPQRVELHRRLEEAQSEANLFRDALNQEERLAALDDESSRLRAAVATQLLDADDRRRTEVEEALVRSRTGHGAALVDLQRSERERALSTMAAQTDTIAALRHAGRAEQDATSAVQERCRELEAELDREVARQANLAAELEVAEGRGVHASVETIKAQAEVRALEQELRSSIRATEAASARAERVEAGEAAVRANKSDLIAARREFDAERAKHADALAQLNAKLFSGESAMAHSARQLKLAQRMLQKERRANERALLDESTLASELKASLSSVVKQSHTIMTGQAAAQKRELTEQAAAMRDQAAQLARVVDALHASEAEASEQQLQLAALHDQLDDALSVGSGQLHQLRRQVQEKHDAHADLHAEHESRGAELHAYRVRSSKHQAELTQSNQDLHAKHAEHEQALASFRRQRLEKDQLRGELAQARIAMATVEAAHARLVEQNANREAAEAERSAAAAAAPPTPPPTPPRVVMRWEEPSAALRLPIGTRVKRGRDWRWGDQDGGAGTLGTVVAAVGLVGPGWCSVRWDGAEGQSTYRVGHQGKCDLVALLSRPAGAPAPAPNGSMQLPEGAKVHIDRNGRVEITNWGEII